MISIKIDSEFAKFDDVALAMMHIAKMIEHGYIEGHYPRWHNEAKEEVESE